MQAKSGMQGVSRKATTTVAMMFNVCSSSTSDASRKIRNLQSVAALAVLLAVSELLDEI